MSNHVRISLGLLMAAFCFAQSSPESRALPDVPYFRHIFMFIANPDDSPATRQSAEAALVTQLRLSEAQAKSLHDLAIEFTAGIAKLQQLAKQNLEGVSADGAMTIPQQITAANLLARRDELTRGLAKRLLSVVGLDAARLLTPPTAAKSRP